MRSTKMDSAAAGSSEGVADVAKLFAALAKVLADFGS